MLQHMGSQSWTRLSDWTGQCCDDLRYTSVWIGHRRTYVPSLLSPLLPPSSSYPARWSQSTSFWQVPWRHTSNSPWLSIFIYFTHRNVYVGLPWWLLQCRRCKFDSWVGGRSPGGGCGNPPQYSCLENPMDRGARRAIIHGSQKVRHDWSDLACHIQGKKPVRQWRPSIAKHK